MYVYMSMNVFYVDVVLNFQGCIAQAIIACLVFKKKIQFIDNPCE